MREMVFKEQIGRMEALFRRKLEAGVLAEYWRALHYVEDEVFEKAVDFVASSFKPFPSEPFPSVATIESAVIDMKEEGMDEVYEPEREGAPPDYSALDFCQKCGNLGLFLDELVARFCSCEKGRLKKASWNVEPAYSNWEKKKRDEKIQMNLARLPQSAGPVRGLQEKNALGFWEANAVEHEAWCADKRKQIEEIKRRREELEEKRREEKKILVPGSLKRILEETMAQVSERMPETEEDGDVPF